VVADHKAGDRLTRTAGSGANADEYRAEATLMQKRQALGNQTSDYSTDSGEVCPSMGRIPQPDDIS
jgi:hypothetical protein